MWTSTKLSRAPAECGLLFHFADGEVSEPHFVGSRALLDPVDLEADEARHHVGLLVDQVGDRDVVDPGLDRLPLGQYAVLVPLALLERGLRLGVAPILAQPPGLEPFTIDEAGGPVDRDLDLRPVDD